MALLPLSVPSVGGVLFGAGLLDEYGFGRSRFGLSDASMARVAETSIRASGAP